METLRSNVAVIGGGTAGLWTAKELIDRGYSVNLYESNEVLAGEASTRNEGWLHSGAYHSVGIKEEDAASAVVDRTRYGHEAIVKFAPDAINQPESYCFTRSEDLADIALRRWADYEVPHREVPIGWLEREGVSTHGVYSAFEVEDKSINTVRMYRKLASWIINGGGSILTGGRFVPVDNHSGYVKSMNSEFDVAADLFVVAAGAGLRDMAEMIAGKSLSMRYYKAHLLVGPQLTDRNVFSLDVGGSGTMNHRGVSVTGINRDGIQLDSPNYDIDEAKTALLHDALGEMLTWYDRSVDVQARTTTVACCKPDIYSDLSDVQSLNIQTFDIHDGYIAALPGKMTESPYLANAVADIVDSRQIPRTGAKMSSSVGRLAVSPRPADRWIAEFSQEEVS